MTACKYCSIEASSIIFKDAQDGLGRTWDEWYCNACDTAWEENVRWDDDNQDRGSDPG